MELYIYKAFGELVKDILLTIVLVPLLVLVFWRAREILWTIPRSHKAVLEKRIKP
jgi:hypothetical protein